MRSATPAWHGVRLLLIALVAFFALAISPRRTTTSVDPGLAGEAHAVSEAPRDAGNQSDADATAPASTPMTFEVGAETEPPRAAPATREEASRIPSRLRALEDTPPPRSA